jgi:hypothetical protein
MSGLLRRIKRSRTAGAGDPPAEGQAAAPEGAPTTAGDPAGGSATAETPAGDEAARAETTELPTATAPAIHGDPDKPAGLEAGAAAQAPSGRRGRLRRRLRYLRRARELMLRDLGGLVYEVHRTGGGDFATHSNVIGGKVERLASLDAETGAIEELLGAPRSESVVFEPGIGGTCAVCGELYGSAARFCSHCAAPTSATHEAEPRPVPAMPKPPGAAVDEGPTPVLAPAADTGARADEPGTAAAEEPAAADEVTPATETGARPDESGTAAIEEPAATDDVVPAEEPAADDAAAPAEEPQRPEPQPDPGRNPFSGISNGRPEDEGQPPELSSGDPLATRESRQ